MPLATIKAASTAQKTPQLKSNIGQSPFSPDRSAKTITLPSDRVISSVQTYSSSEESGNGELRESSYLNEAPNNSISRLSCDSLKNNVTLPTDTAEIATGRIPQAIEILSPCRSSPEITSEYSKGVGPRASPSLHFFRIKNASVHETIDDTITVARGPWQRLSSRRASRFPSGEIEKVPPRSRMPRRLRHSQLWARR